MKDKLKKIEITFYQNNTVAYYLVMLVIAANVYASIRTLSLITPSYKIGVSVIFNIVLILVLFLCAIKIKFYGIKWIWFNFGLMIYTLIRNLVIYPKFYSLNFTQIKAAVIINYVAVIFLLIANVLTIKKVEDQATYRKLNKLI